MKFEKHISDGNLTCEKCSGKAFNIEKWICENTGDIIHDMICTNCEEVHPTDLVKRR